MICDSWQIYTEGLYFSEGKRKGVGGGEEEGWGVLEEEEEGWGKFGGTEKNN